MSDVTPIRKTRRKRVCGMGETMVNLNLCAEMFGLSRRTLQHYSRDGKLHFQKYASVAYVLLAEMESVLGTFVYAERMRRWKYDPEQRTYVRA